MLFILGMWSQCGHSSTVSATRDRATERLARIPDLSDQLRDATPAVKRQIFEAFELPIEFDKASRRMQISATVTEAVAKAFENTKALHSEGFVANGSVPISGIAGAGLGRKSATVAAAAKSLVLQGKSGIVTAFAYRIEESWQLQREPIWRRSLALPA
jgi:hypothetical protein